MITIFLGGTAHIMSAEPNSLSAGVQGPLNGPRSSRVVLMLSCAIRVLFLSILICKKWILKTLPPPPPGSTTVSNYVHSSKSETSPLNCGIAGKLKFISFE